MSKKLEKILSSTREAFMDSWDIYGPKAWEDVAGYLAERYSTLIAIAILRSPAMRDNEAGTFGGFKRTFQPDV